MNSDLELIGVFALLMWLMLICGLAMLALCVAADALSWLAQRHRSCCIVVGGWMLRDWHLYRYTLHRSAKRPDTVRWHMWDRVL